VILMGEQVITGNIDGKEMPLELVQKIDNSHFIFEGIVPDVKPRAYTAEFDFDDNLSIYNVYGELFESSSDFTDKLIIRADK
ncbi:hypothetical protein HP456_15245, partial [Bacillus haikouensis]|uniref:hypothetical protein n=1 Tax=Bacillus haikouensis TaxID=1510468 RepID=UPI001555AAB5